MIELPAADVTKRRPRCFWRLSPRRLGGYATASYGWLASCSGFLRAMV